MCFQTNFTSVESLKISLLKVSNRPLMCPICNEILLGLDKLTIHIFGHSLMVTPPPPLLPPSSLYSQCQPTCSSSSSLKSVRKIKNTNAVERTNEEIVIVPQCDICGFIFHNRELLAMHINLVHQIKNENIITNTSILNQNQLDLPKMVKTVKVDEVNKFQCHLCPKVFKMIGSLKVHVRVAHFGFHNRKNTSNIIKLEQELIKIEDQQQSPSPSIIVASTSTGTTLTASASTLVNCCEPSKVWECDVCAKSFTTKYFLKKHKRLHTGLLI